MYKSDLFLKAYNHSATTAPGVNDDSTKGYLPGSTWINVTSKVAYTCVDGVEGAALWSVVGNLGSGDLTQTDLDRYYYLPDLNNASLEVVTTRGTQTLTVSGPGGIKVNNGSGTDVVELAGGSGGAGRIYLQNRNFTIGNNGPSQFFIQGAGAYNGKMGLNTGAYLQAPDANRAVELGGHHIRFKDRTLVSTWARFDDNGYFIQKGQTSAIPSLDLDDDSFSLHINSGALAGKYKDNLGTVTDLVIAGNISNTDLTFDGDHSTDLDNNGWMLKTGAVPVLDMLTTYYNGYGYGGFANPASHSFYTNSSLIFKMSHVSGGRLESSNGSYLYLGSGSCGLSSIGIHATAYADIVVYPSITLKTRHGSVGQINIDSNAGIMFKYNGTEHSRFHNNGTLVLGSTVNTASALLDLTSTTKGFLPPRMTTAERDLIGTPVGGLEIYNTTTNKKNFYNGSVWEVVTSA